MKRFVASMALASTVLVTSCASIISDSSYPVAIKSSPDGANFVIQNRKGEVVHKGTTPATVTLEASQGFFSGETYTIDFKKAGMANKTMVLDSGIDGWYIANILFGGLIGLLIVDPLTGAMYKLPESITASMDDSQAADAGNNTLRVVSIDSLTATQREQLIPLR